VENPLIIMGDAKTVNLETIVLRIGCLVPRSRP